MCNSGIHCFNQQWLLEVYNRKKYDNFLFIYYLFTYLFIYLFTNLFTYVI